MTGADQCFHYGAVDRGVEALIDRVGVDDMDFHALLITGSISRVPEAWKVSVMVRQSTSRVSAASAPVPGLTGKAGKQAPARLRRMRLPAGIVTQTALMPIPSGRAVSPSSTRR